MPPEMECQIISVSNSALEEVSDEKVFETQKYGKISGIIKRYLSNSYGKGWFVICGKNFGTYVSHEQGTFIHFSFGELHFCVFKA